MSCLCNLLPKDRYAQLVNPYCPFHGANRDDFDRAAAEGHAEEMREERLGSGDHPIFPNVSESAWAGKKKEQSFEVRLFAGMRMVRLELLDANGKHVDHVDMTNEEYLHVCGFKDMVENA